MTRDEMKVQGWVCVLNDGHTFTGLEGCWIATTDESTVASLDADEVSVGEVPGPHWLLDDLVMWAITEGYFDTAGRKD